MKKTGAMAVLLAGMLCFQVSAASFADWLNVGQSNSKVTQSGDSVVVEGEGYYPAKSNGVLLAEPVSLKDGVSIEFVPDVLPGLADDGADSWISVGLFNRKAYMDITNPAKSAGLVILIRPTRTGANISTHSLLEGQNFSQNTQTMQVTDFKAGQPYKLELKPDEANGFAFYWNNRRLDTVSGTAPDFVWLKDAKILDENAYLAFSMSDSTDTKFKATITKVNEKTAVGAKDTDPIQFETEPAESTADSAVESTSAADESGTAPESRSTSSESSENAGFNPTPWIIAGVVAAIIAAAVIVSTVRKKKAQK